MSRPAPDAPASAWQAYAAQLEAQIAAFQTLPPQIARLYAALQAAPNTLVSYTALARACGMIVDRTTRSDRIVVKQTVIRLRKLRPELRIVATPRQGYQLIEEAGHAAPR